MPKELLILPYDIPPKPTPRERLKMILDRFELIIAKLQILFLPATLLHKYYNDFFDRDLNKDKDQKIKPLMTSGNRFISVDNDWYRLKQLPEWTMNKAEKLTFEELEKRLKGLTDSKVKLKKKQADLLYKNAFGKECWKEKVQGYHFNSLEELLSVVKINCVDVAGNGNRKDFAVAEQGAALEMNWQKLERNLQAVMNGHVFVHIDHISHLYNNYCGESFSHATSIEEFENYVQSLDFLVLLEGAWIRFRNIEKAALNQFNEEIHDDDLIAQRQGNFYSRLNFLVNPISKGCASEDDMWWMYKSVFKLNKEKSVFDHKYSFHVLFSAAPNRFIGLDRTVTELCFDSLYGFRQRDVSLEKDIEYVLTHVLCCLPEETHQSLSPEEYSTELLIEAYKDIEIL